MNDEGLDLSTTLREAVAQMCNVPVEAVQLESRLNALGVDSLTFAEVVTELEIRAGIELPPEVLRRLGSAETVGEVLSRVQEGLPGLTRHP